ncbi:MAG TPA: hypothetical protein VK609_18525 [Mucilaginibacter sp.]|nr:hypothetical protein [Mucilaginibacter sp.]
MVLQVTEDGDIIARIDVVFLQDRRDFFPVGFAADSNHFLDQSLVIAIKKAKSVCNTHYNLHGSAFWKVLDLDKDQLANPEIVLPAGLNLPINNSPASFQVEKGKTLMVTNIVTGYQKAQKAMITPIKQMQAAFDKDCSFAEHIYLIGYSLGDEHINESIKTAIRHNPTVKISIVDPFFIKNEMDLQIGLRFNSKQTGNFSPTNINTNVYGYLDGTITVYNFEI